MKTVTQKTNGKFYTKLFAHCQKQYKNIDRIFKAYIIDGQVFAIDYLTTNGLNSIASNTFQANTIVTFK